VFRDLLARHGAMDCDEIFHGEPNPDFPLRFYEHVAQHIFKKSMYANPLRHRGLFYSYVNKLRELAGGRRLAMDVKYFALNLIPQEEDVLGERPFIVDYMREQNANVVHVVRRNKLRVHVSEQMAYATGRWSAGDHSSIPESKPQLKLDVEKAVAFIERQIILDQHVTKLLDTIPRVVRLHYDAMFDADGLFTQAVQQVAAQVMDLDAVDPKPGNLKMNPEPLADLVANYDALAEALAATPHAWMLSDSH
jgi:hypothetical protein